MHLTKRHLPQDYIDYFEKLGPHLSPDASTNEHYSNPLVSIITPEWYYSDSISLNQGHIVTGKSLKRLVLLVKSLGNYRTMCSPTMTTNSRIHSLLGINRHHFKPRDKWGIHLRYDSWIRTAKKFQLKYHSLHSNSSKSTKASIFVFSQSPNFPLLNGERFKRVRNSHRDSITILKILFQRLL